jgi:hypothetical protein
VLLKCAACESPDGVQMESSRTCYEPPKKTIWHHVKDVEPEDPNADIPLCGACATKHEEYWDEMWHDYYSSRF